MDNNKSKDIFQDGFQFNFDEDTQMDNNEAAVESNNKDNSNKTSNSKDTSSLEQQGSHNKPTTNQKDTQVQTSSNDFLSNLNRTSNESFEEEQFTYQKNSHAKKWLIQSGILIVALVAVYLIINKKTALIDFTNMAYDDVAAWASSKNIVLASEEQYSNDIPMDHIISQDINPGEKIQKDSAVKIVVSKGLDPYEEVAIPEFDTSWSKTSIENWIEQNGIINYSFINTENEEIPANYLISYELIGATQDTFVRSSEIAFTISYIEAAETITVPDFMNKTIIDVDIWAKQNGIDYIYNYEKSTLYDEDKIMNQNVQSGEEISIEDVFSVVISTGEDTDTILMDNFLNKSIVEADIWAKNNHIKYTYSYQYSDIYPKDTILYQSVLADEEINEGDTVRFTISDGTEEEDVIVMEDFLNKSLLDADIWTKNNEVNYNYSYEYSSIYGKDKILYQSITPGSEIAADMELIFTVSKGEEIYVPDFQDMTVAEAKSYEDPLIDVAVIEKYMNNIKTGEFLSQSTQAGEIVEEGTEVIVEYSLGDRVTVPSFINELQQQIKDWIEEENSKGASIKLAIEEKNDSGLEYGKIISQNIFNDDMSLSETINIAISSGLTIPSFMSMSQKEAENYSDTSDINVDIIELYKAGTSVGDFISQSIETGTKVNKGTKVTVEYSLGDTITIPKFVNRPVIELEEWVKEQNNKGAAITLTVTEVHHTELDYGIIFAQNIYNKSTSEINTNIEIVVSLGDLYSVIDFTELSVSEIESIASDNNLTIIFEKVESTSYSSGTIISQEPEAGELISKKDFIKIKMAE